MDLKSMGRKELQALCKKHGIPANMKNSQMIESLSSILQDKVKPKGCLKGSGGSSTEDLGVSRGRLKKVTFVVEDEEEDGDREFVVNPVGKSKRKSVGRKSSVAPKLVKGSGSESPKNAIEVLQRTTRSRGLAEAVLWSPVIEKKKTKKLSDGTEGVRQNAEATLGKEKMGISGAVPTTRSLRNRAVTVGGDEKVVIDQNPRSTRKTKDNVKKEENEKVVALQEDEAVGRRNLRKRSRDVESVEDERPCRRSTRSHVKVEEAEAVEEADVGRSKKRRKGGLEVSVMEKVVDEETERVSKPGGNAKRLMGNTSGDANDEAVATFTRRSTRSSSAILEEGDAVRKGKSQKQVKARVSKGGDSVNLLTDSKVLAEPVWRSTRSSSTLPEDGTSLPAVVKSVKGGRAVKKGKSLKQAKGLKGENTTTSLPDMVLIAKPIRRSTHSSSLLENWASIPVVGKSVEEGEVIATPARRSMRSSSKPLEIEMPNNEAFTSPTRKATRSSSKLLEAEMPNNDAVTSPMRRSMQGSSKLGQDEMLNNDAVTSPTRISSRSSSKLVEVQMPNNEAVTSPMRRLTHSSLKLLEDEMPSNEAVSTPTRGLIRSSSKMSEDETFSSVVQKLGTRSDTVNKDNSRKQQSNSAVKQGDSTAPLPNSEAVVTPARRSTRSSSKLAADEIPNKIAVTAPTRRSAHSSLKLLEDEMLDNESAAAPTRRSTLGSPKMVAAETSSPVVCKLDVQSDAVRKDKSGKQPKDYTSKQVDSTPSLSKNDAFITPSRRSTRSSSKFFEDEMPNNKTEALKVSFKAAAQTEPLEVYEQYELPRRSTRSVSKHDKSSVPAGLLTVSDEILGTNKKKKRTREAVSKDDAFVMERETIGGSGGRGTLQVSSSNSQRKSLRKVPADPEVVQRQCSPHSSSLSENDKNVSEMQQSPVNVQLQIDESGTSLVSTPKDLEDVCFGSHIREKQSSFREMENEVRDSLSLNVIEDSSEIQGNVSGEPMCSNIDITVEAEGPLELYGDAIGNVSAPVELTSSAVKVSCGGSSVGAIDDVVGITGMESQNITSLQVPLENSEEPSTTFHTEISIMAPLKEPDSAAEVVECEDMLTGYEEALVSGPQLPCKSSAELSLTSNTEASPGIHLEGPHSPAEICDSTENALEGNEATDVREPTFVCKGSELLSPPSNSEASPVTDLKDLDSKVETNVPSEDISADSGATKVMDPIISNTEVCLKVFCDINAEGLDSKVEDHVTSKGGVEGSEDTNAAGSPLSYKSTGVLSPTLLNEVSDIDLGESAVKAGSHDMSKVASFSNDFLYEASDNHSKILKESTTEDWDALYLSDIKRMFDNETENCLVDQDNTLNSQPSSGECDAGKKIESPQGNSDPLSCEAGPEVVKETWVSSKFSITVNDGIETEVDINDAEKKGDELRSSSMSEDPAFDLCSGDHLKEHGRQSSEEIVDQATAFCSHGGAKQSAFSHNLCDNDPVGIDGNSGDPFDDKFCEDNNSHFLSSVASVEPEENEFSHSKIGVSSEIGEEKWNVEHGSSIHSLVSGSKSVKQMEKEGRLLEVDLKSTRFSASTSDNKSLTDAVLFGGVKEVNKAEDLPSVLISLSGSEEILPISITGVPTSLGYEGSTKQVDIQDFPCIPDSEDIKHLSDQQEITVHVTESLDVDSADRSPKSTPKAHDTAKPVNVVADVLPETVDTANELTDMKFERILEVGALVAEETENIEFLKSASIEGGHDTVMKKADSIVRDKFDHGEVGKQQDDTYLLRETDALSGEHHTDDISSHPSVENSASIPEDTLLSLGNSGSSMHGENESNDEKGKGAKSESRLLCNIHEDSFAVLGESKEEERAQVSQIKPECVLEATMIGEQHTTPSTSEGTFLIPTDSLNCKDNGPKGAYITALSEPRNEDGINVKNDNVELKESLDLNTNIASNEKAEGEHGADHSIDMSFGGMAQDSEVTGISENNEASPAEDSSSKAHTQDEESNKNQGTFESFVQACNVEDVCDAPGVTVMTVEELFHMDSKVATSVNDSAPVGQLGHHGDNLAHKKCGNFSEINISEALAIREWEMKAVAVSGSSDAEAKEAGPCKCEMSSENFSGSSAKPCTGMDSQGTYSAEQSEGQEEIIIFSQEKASEVSEDKMFTLLDGTKPEGSAIVESKSEEIEITPATAVARQKLSARGFTTLSVSDDADQVLLWDRNECMETSVGNELEDSKFRATVTAQHSLISLDSEAARESSTTMQEESIVSKDEIMTTDEYLEDFWSFADTMDVGNSHQEVRAVDSQLPVESTIANSTAHSSKSGVEGNQEQSKSSELDQIEESKECVHNTPMQLVRNFKPYPVIDDVIKNKENALGLKMDDTQKHNDKSVVSNSSRRPLQCRERYG